MNMHAMSWCSWTLHPCSSAVSRVSRVLHLVLIIIKHYYKKYSHTPKRLQQTSYLYGSMSRFRLVNGCCHLHCILRSPFLEVNELHNLGHDEALFEVRVYLARSLRSLRVFLQWCQTIYNCVLSNSKISFQKACNAKDLIYELLI